MTRHHWAVALLLLATFACGEGGGGVDPGPAPELRFATVASGLENPVFLTAAPGDSTRLFVVEQEGRIRIIRNDTLLATPFLDIEDSVSHGNEQGLLGLAFAPDYATSGAFYVFTTDLAGDIRILRFKVTGNPESADLGSGVEVLAFQHPNTNHNGGMLAFGTDGFLYIGSGDGGGGGDPLETGQNPADLLGAILRIDVSGDSAGYTIPFSNPYRLESSFAPEIFAWGLRNPWRFSLDRATQDLWIGDVGQQNWEEVDFIPANTGGRNFGWDILEGTHCFEPSSGCSTLGTTVPLFEYSHADGRCSVIGGYVYRGADSALASITGHYVYGDLCDGRVRVWHEGDEFDTNIGSSILSFGEDLLGRLYVLTGDGEVRRITSIIFLL